MSNIFRVTSGSKGKLADGDCASVRNQIETFTANSSQSSLPAIYGVVAAAEVQRLRPLSTSAASQDDAAKLELAAAEMAQAAAELVTLERAIIAMVKDGADVTELRSKEAGRVEAAAALERRMAAMEAVLAARRALVLEPAKPEKAAEDQMKQKLEQLMAPPKVQAVGSGPACGTGHEILFQVRWTAWIGLLAGGLLAFMLVGMTVAESHPIRLFLLLPALPAD